MKVIYFGTPQFAADVLTYLLDHNVDIVAVVTKPDRPKGRSLHTVPTPVKSVALAHSLPLFQPEVISAEENIFWLQQFDADLFVVVAYGEILKQHVLDLPKVACINLHASLLPKYRGAAPIQRAIIEGEKETGITIMHMVKKMDAGDIIATTVVPIGKNTTYGELEATLQKRGAKLLLETIKRFEQGDVPSILQDPTLVTFAPKIEMEDCCINWDLEAQVIHDLVRGVNPHPGAWCWVLANGEKKRLRILETEVASLENEHRIKGFTITPKEGIIVVCGKGVLRLIKVQLEGKKGMSSAELVRGLRIEMGVEL